ncbi:MAG: ribosome maturation factor RimP [Sulfuricaulis sp.]|jgi:ribosome maturation factor RimP|uniref:ribosome maturation factor RimP n=1 Tax=Sulfuricaulis sp. TaxID=2003553 RepID=UPI002CD3B128|nr:ribosome maturation factor RimP [Sulfuricaulis sp.]
MRTRAELRKLLEPGVAATGFDLVEVELAGSHHHPTLRVYIDSPAGVNVDDCARVSRQLSALLDVEDPLPGHYTLEVSSPGLDRPLVKPEDFMRYVGETIKIKMQQPMLGRRNFSGRLVDVTADHVVIEVDKERFDLTFEGMERARLVPRL